LAMSCVSSLEVKALKTICLMAHMALPGV